MLSSFLSNFSKFNNIEVFEYGTILSPDKKTGNLLGEFILESRMIVSNARHLSVIPATIARPILVKSVFSYPFYFWEEIIVSHPDFDGESQICDHLKCEKLIACSRLWMEQGFKVPVEGANDTISTQLFNARRLLEMDLVDQRELARLTELRLYLSGMFGKTVSLTANFNKNNQNHD